MTDFIARLGHSIDLGVFTITPSEGDLVGTTARLRIGRRGETHLVELLSQSPPVLGTFTWNDTTGDLAIDLHQSHVDAAGVGLWTYQADVIRANGTVLEGPSGKFEVRPQVG